MRIKEMMKRGMIVDIDHMSNKRAEGTLEIAEKFDFPVVSGHSGIRGQGGANAENSRTQDAAGAPRASCMACSGWARMA